jgi:hypothetical protein
MLAGGDQRNVGTYAEREFLSHFGPSVGCVR